MKLLRFMSVEEFTKFRNGELLENTTDHSAGGAHTDAVGFCFLDYEQYDEQYAYHFLSGVVNGAVAAVFEISDDDVAKLKHGTGLFADPHGSFFQTMTVDEFSTVRYHNKAFKLIKFCDDFDNRFKDDSFDRIFDWKPPTAPLKRNIEVVDKNPPAKIKLPDTPEQRLANAVLEYAASKIDIPPEYAQGFMFTGNLQVSVNYEFGKEIIHIDGLQITRVGGGL